MDQATDTARPAAAAYSPISVTALRSAEHAGLQATDYFLWALQRAFERGEDRFIRLLWPACRLVIDLDDQRTSRTGTRYTQKKPLTAAALKAVPGI